MCSKTIAILLLACACDAVKTNADVANKQMMRREGAMDTNTTLGFQAQKQRLMLDSKGSASGFGSNSITELQSGNESAIEQQGEETAQTYVVSYLCIKGEVYFKTSADAEEYFLDQCTGPYGYNLKFCEGLAEQVFEEAVRSNVTWDPTANFCNEIKALRRADCARSQDLHRVCVSGTAPKMPKPEDLDDLEPGEGEMMFERSAKLGGSTHSTGLNGAIAGKYGSSGGE